MNGEKLPSAHLWWLLRSRKVLNPWRCLGWHNAAFFARICVWRFCFAAARDQTSMVQPQLYFSTWILIICCIERGVEGWRVCLRPLSKLNLCTILGWMPESIKTQAHTYTKVLTRMHCMRRVRLWPPWTPTNRKYNFEDCVFVRLAVVRNANSRKMCTVWFRVWSSRLFF